MRSNLIVLVVLITLGLVSAGKVVDLTSDTFDSHIANNDLTLVKFYAPWCGHCKALAPEYDQAAERLDGTYFAKVDCTKESELCGKYNVRGYPTLILINKDKSTSNYEGARKADALVKFINKYLLPAFTISEDAAAVEKFIATAPVAGNKVVFYSKSDADTEVFKKIAAAKRDDADFTIVPNSPVTKVVFYRDGTQAAAVESGNESEINDFLATEQFPPVGEIGPENYAKYAERDLPLVWTFVHYDKPEAETIPKALTPVAEKYRKEFLVVKLDANRWGDHGRNFGLNSFPGVVLEHRQTKKNYIFPADATITTEAFGQFIEDFKAGKLSPNVRSQEPPASNDGPVTVVVGKTWDSIVMDSTKDVLIEFYAPWCGHCKSLAPKYEQLGEQFKSTPSVVIAKIDGTENDTPVDIAGFPTIYFYPANHKDKPVQYSGSRTVEDMAEFIRKHADTLTGADATLTASRTEL